MPESMTATTTPSPSVSAGSIFFTPKSPHKFHWRGAYSGSGASEVVRMWSASAHATRGSASNASMISVACSLLTASLISTVCTPLPRSVSGVNSNPSTDSEPVAIPSSSVASTPSLYFTMSWPTTPSTPLVGVTKNGPATSLAPKSLRATTLTSYSFPLMRPDTDALRAGAVTLTTTSPGVTVTSNEVDALLSCVVSVATASHSTSIP